VLICGRKKKEYHWFGGVCGADLYVTDKSGEQDLLFLPLAVCGLSKSSCMTTLVIAFTSNNHTSTT
jgi:hypothetical protein